ncbi:tagaturonate reductase [Flavisolibacter ginsenosidimutans]|uniref:Tagaturonate reductase n=1 Tax=Flavisolibacter ginsenosidimutans TaxID=661481 RepID=A0A5B8UNS6_9BACT|nr:tagaturonate reductase [Flavisolibacter ginsenosidimutans]QEC58032.1 tagaturonate reductase [Flavisolibacter ginsenosidimutans]
MILSRYTLRNISPENVAIPEETLFDLPERVLQFGTGVLLRGLPDYFIDKANRQGIFNGRVVVVKSTSHGDTSAFDKQDGLYTLCVRGLQNGEKIEENIINSSISRVLTATEQWNEILDCAHNSQMQIIISNTTEVGIQLVHEDIRQTPPKSFPGKLLAFLYERFKAFGGSEKSGMVIVPTELIPENGTKLQAIILELAHLNSLEDSFIEWLEGSNHFCNSLVDRIVPGKPDAATLKELEDELGYTDGNLSMSEVYRLWAIEGGEEVKSILSFAQADDGVVIEPDIDIFRELKLRMLNGTHTLSCGLAYLAGFETVKQAMDDETMSGFIADVMQNEIASNIPYDVDLSTAQDFGNKVLDRFRNPHIRHQWISITMNYSSKLKMRCVPVLLQHYKKTSAAPEAIALGFAAYLLFMKGVTVRDGKYYGDLNGTSYFIQDDTAEIFYKRWAKLSPADLVKETLRDAAYWGADLHSLPGFAKAVTDKLNLLLNSGAKAAVIATESNKEKIA